MQDSTVSIFSLSSRSEPRRELEKEGKRDRERQVVTHRGVKQWANTFGKVGGEYAHPEALHAIIIM